MEYKISRYSQRKHCDRCNKLIYFIAFNNGTGVWVTKTSEKYVGEEHYPRYCSGKDLRKR